MENDDKLLTSLNKYTTYHDTSRKFLKSVNTLIESIDGDKAWYLLQSFEEIAKPSGPSWPSISLICNAFHKSILH